MSIRFFDEKNIPRQKKNHKKKKLKKEYKKRENEN